MKNISINIAISLMSVIVFFLIFEAAARIIKLEFTLTNYQEQYGTLFGSSYPAQYDSLLGWTLIKGKNAKKTIWSTKVTIDKAGYRSNDNVIIASDIKILAVGDSFTFGDQVSDSDTWPSVLEREIQHRVLNGGVFGYGIDQSFLRASKIIQEVHPDVLIFSFIPDDIERNELKYRNSVYKPYYELEGGELILKNNPVPERKNKKQRDNFQQIGGYSYIVHLIMKNWFIDYWRTGKWASARVHPDKPGHGAEISCHLFDKLSSLAKKNQVKPLILIQYPQELRPLVGSNPIHQVLECLEKSDLPFLDLYQPLAIIQQKEPEQYQILFDGHMTQAGNIFVSEQVEKKLLELGYFK